VHRLSTQLTAAHEDAAQARLAVRGRLPQLAPPRTLPALWQPK
jgi:hypothetical protein